jgi:cystathionine beta-lyase/cystathionine gamma-synthase
MSDIHNIEHRRNRPGEGALPAVESTRGAGPAYGIHPGRDAAATVMARLEGTESALVLSSGMAATSCTLLSLLRPGDSVLASSLLFGATRRFLERELAAFGAETTFVDPMEPRAWRRAVRSSTRVLFLESPVNPTTRVIDMRPARILARDVGLVLVVDATIASPVNFRPVEHGADVVIHSAAPYLDGHHDVEAGVVCGSAAVIEETRARMEVWGQAPDPFALWLLERGLRTLDVRVQRQNASAMRVAEWAAAHPAVRAVHYPGLPSHPDHDVAASQLVGFGGMLAIELAGGADAAVRMLPALKLFTTASAPGGVDSRVIEPRGTSHRGLSPEQRAAHGVPDGFLQLSVGLEAADDLIADLEHALRITDGPAGRSPSASRTHLRAT